MEEAIIDAGFEAKLISQGKAQGSSDKLALKISGMTCSSCSSAVEKALKGVKGVQSASVNLLAEKADVRLTQDMLSYLLLQCMSSSACIVRFFLSEEKLRQPAHSLLQVAA